MTARVIGVFLDGWPADLAEELMAAGELEALAGLGARGAHIRLDHGDARRTGLAGEHVSTGQRPEVSGRHSAVVFDPATYRVHQRQTDLTPFTARLAVPSAVFDVPYFSIDRSPPTRGVVSWGVHDPGVPPGSRPEDLLAELTERFGPYPAHRWMYALTWASPEETRRMGEALTAAADVRTDVARWLLGERLGDWRLALVGEGETHSATETFFHGVDPTNRLADHPSAPVAAGALRSVLRATDRMVGALVADHPDAVVAAFALHGMGSNAGEVANMALAPELLARWAGLAPRLRPPEDWPVDRPVDLPAGASWSATVRRYHRRPLTTRLRARVSRSLSGRPPSDGHGLGWMPATWYADAWPRMPAFAIPAFYDTRIRVNLAGRERVGIVEPADYDRVLDDVERLLRACVDPVGGRPVYEVMQRPARERSVDPVALEPTEADLIAPPTGGPVALTHPVLGTIGPLPHRRTGGHSGRWGHLLCAGPGVAAGVRGDADAFDVVPTLVTLAGVPVPPGLSGRPIPLHVDHRPAGDGTARR